MVPPQTSLSKKNDPVVSGGPEVILLDDQDHMITIIDNHFDPPTQRTDMLTKLPAGYPVPLLQYLVRDFTVSLCLYGGHDFERSSTDRLSHFYYTL